MPTVFVIGKDWTLRSLVRAQLREHGIEALGLESLDEAAQTLASGTMPSLIIVDAASPEPVPAALATLARRVPLVVVASRTEPPLALHAAAVLYRPVSIGEIVSCAEALLQGQAV